MSKRDIIEFKCDVCGKVFQFENKEKQIKNPLKVITIPSRNYDCEGRTYSKGMCTADMCDRCFEDYWNFTQTKYDVSDCYGIKIKIIGEAK